MKKGFVRNRFCISFLVVVLVLGFVGVVSADDDFVDNIGRKVAIETVLPNLGVNLGSVDGLEYNPANGQLKLNEVVVLDTTDFPLDVVGVSVAENGDRVYEHSGGKKVFMSAGRMGADNLIKGVSSEAGGEYDARGVQVVFGEGEGEVRVGVNGRIEYGGGVSVKVGDKLEFSEGHFRIVGSDDYEVKGRFDNGELEMVFGEQIALGLEDSGNDYSGGENYMKISDGGRDAEGNDVLVVDVKLSELGEGNDGGVQIWDKGLKSLMVNNEPMEGRSVDVLNKDGILKWGQTESETWANAGEVLFGLELCRACGCGSQSCQPGISPGVVPGEVAPIQGAFGMPLSPLGIQQTPNPQLKLDPRMNFNQGGPDSQIGSRRGGGGLFSRIRNFFGRIRERRQARDGGLFSRWRNRVKLRRSSGGKSFGGCGGGSCYTSR